MHRDAQVVGILCHFEVERGIVDKNQRIGLPLVDGAARRAQEAQDLAQVLHHVGKAHIGHVLVVDDGLPAGLGCHKVTAQEAEPGLRVQLPDGVYQMGGMQVARGLPGNEEILHSRLRCRVIKSNS